MAELETEFCLTCQNSGTTGRTLLLTLPRVVVTRSQGASVIAYAQQKTMSSVYAVNSPATKSDADAQRELPKEEEGEMTGGIILQCPWN